MKLNILLLSISLTVSLFACGNDEKKQDTGDSLEGVRSENISDIIRMPVSAADTMDTSALARIYFEDTGFDFDTIYEGDIAQKVFTFKNTGKVSLLINDVHSPCGCTVPTWPKEPIAPGDEGEILIKFNSQGKAGHQAKGVSIYANTYPNRTLLRVYGFVKPKNQKK